MSWATEISWWMIAFFAILPIASWSIGELLRKVAILERKIEPKMTIEFNHTPPYEEIKTDDETGGVVRVFCIGIKNNGLADLLNCVVYIKNVKDIDGNILWDVPISLRRRGAGSEVFPLRPLQEKHIMVASLQENRGDTEINIYHTQSGLRTMIPRGEYVFTIEVYAFGSFPANQPFTLFVDGQGQLKLEEDDG